MAVWTHGASSYVKSIADLICSHLTLPRAPLTGSTQLPTPVHFSVLCLGVCVTFGVHNYLQEAISRMDGSVCIHELARAAVLLSCTSMSRSTLLAFAAGSEMGHLRSWAREIAC